jgi:phage terminase large subunit
MMMRNKFVKTTAIKKILKLKERKKVIQGGTSAGKTFGIIPILIDYAIKNPLSEISIVAQSYPHLRRGAMKDFVKVMIMTNRFFPDRWNKSESRYTFSNKSYIEFFSVEQEHKVRGARRNVLYVNEANNINFETYNQLAIRTSGDIYIDYNPTSEFWAHTEVVKEKDSDFIILTYKDNEALAPEIVEEIEKAKEKGKKSEYWKNWWNVYGLGRIGSLQGGVFTDWETIEMPKDARLLYYGCDFGYATSKFAVIGIYNWNGRKVLKQFVYKTNLTNQQGAEEFKRQGYNGGVVYCDSAEPKSIRELQIAGIQAVKCDSKQDIKTYAIQSLNEDTFYVDENSTDLIDELRYYVYDEKTGKPKKSDKDHLMDAMLYAIGSGDKYNGKYR